MLFLCILYVITWLVVLILQTYVLIEYIKFDKQLKRERMYELKQFEKEIAENEKACEAFIDRYLADNDQ